MHRYFWKQIYRCIPFLFEYKPLYIFASHLELVEGYESAAQYKDKDGKTAYPLGTYVIQEVAAPTGYLVNDEKLVVHITEDGTDNLHVSTYNESIKGDDTIIRGGVKLAKIDNDLDEAYAQGDATLEGAEFTVYNKSKESVMVNGQEYAVDAACLVITTDADGIAASAQRVLPYGTYLVKETKPSKGYLLNKKWSRSFEIREDGVIIDLTEDKVREAVERGGVQIIKRDKELAKPEALGGATLNGIVMTIKNVSGHDVVVRKDLDTKDKLEEDEDADTARKQNPFDDLLTAEKITTAAIKERKEDIKQGVWFGTGEFGSKADMNSNFGALPYDSYVIEELPCEKNEGFTLQKFFFTVDEKSQNGFVDLETITDDIPEIGTEASINGKNADVTPQKEIILIDTIQYTGLKKGEQYTAKGRLIDKATGDVMKDAEGKEITAEQEFTARGSNGKVKVTFTFDGSNMYSKYTVVYEQVFGSDGHIVAKHEDIEDEGQTVIWEKPDPKYEMYKIRTTKAPSKGDKFGFFAQDEVEYLPCAPDNQAEHAREHDAMDGMDRAGYIQHFEKSLSLDALRHDFPYQKDQLEEIKALLAEVCSSRKNEIRIGGDEKPAEDVRQRFMSLNSEHIRYVLESMNGTTSRVRNIRQYLLTAMYNAPLTINSYYDALVRHDMYGK